MIFYSTYDILDEIYYKKERPGIVTDVQFTLDDETGYMIETYGITFEDGSYQFYVNPSDLSYRQIFPLSQLS